jgi:hypothetical protein
MVPGIAIMLLTFSFMMWFKGKHLLDVKEYHANAHTPNEIFYIILYYFFLPLQKKDNGDHHVVEKKSK